MSSCLIISDIHLNFRRAEYFISKIKTDKIIFLGDELDDFFDTPEMARETAIWLKSSLQQENRIHLLANHTLPYYAASIYAKRCSGYTQEKDDAVSEILNQHDWSKLKWFYWVDNFLFSHAGLSPHFCKYTNKKEINDFLEREQKIANKKIMEINGSHWFFRAGLARGGNEVVGGLTWLDFDCEFVPIEGISQVIGHTPRDEPEWKSGNLCLDTKMNHCAILDDGKIEVIAYKDL